MNIANSKQAAKRMSQNVEQLQWRMKNNFESNVQYVFDQKDKIEEFYTQSQFYVTLHRNAMYWVKSLHFLYIYLDNIYINSSSHIFHPHS